MKKLKDRWLLTNAGLVLISGLAGLSGYVFNLLISRLWDVLTLGGIIGVLGAVAFLGLPATLMILPVAQWSIRSAAWRKKLPQYQLATFLAGLLLLGLLLLLEPLWAQRIAVPPDWRLPLYLWLLPAYLFAFNTGVFLGRRAYWMMGIVSGIPQIGKPVLLSLGFLWEPLTHTSASALWIAAAAQWAGTLIGAAGVYRIRQTDVNRDLPASLWATGWVSVATHAWITWDSAVAYMVLSAGGLSVYGVVSTLGKTPFYLANHVSNIGISEEGWGMNRKRATQWMIVGVGLLVAIGFLAIGPFLMRLFGLTRGLPALLVYTLANTILALIYFNTGADAQEGKHTWYPVGLSLAAWTLWAAAARPDETEFMFGIGLFLLLALLGGWGLKELYRRRERS